MKISDFALRTHVSTDTVRYYEKIGLLPPARRDVSGHRQYDERDLVWMEFLGRLKTTGMPIREMLTYAGLRESGAGTEAERCEILKTHREQVRAQISALSESLNVLDTKIKTYETGLSGKGRPHD